MPLSSSAETTPVNSDVGRYRWIICALLFFATTINYVDRQILALLKPILDDQLKWTNAEFGYINSAFQGAYAFGILFFGWFVDRFGTKIGYTVSIAAWSLAALGHGFVGSVRGFLLARVALGLGEGGNFPSAIKSVALWFPKKERALATSIFNSGTNVGAIIAPTVVPWIAFTWGWQAAFVAAGLAGMLWLFLWIPVYNVPEKIARLKASELAYIRSDVDPTQAEQTNKVSWRELLGYRQTWSFILAKMLTDPVWWFFLTWLPDYFKQARHLDIKSSQVYLITIYSLVTVLSIAGGWLTGYFTSLGWSITRARKTTMLVSAIFVIPIICATKVGDWTAVILIGVAMAAHQAWSANLFTTASDLFPKRAVASIIGLGGMAGSVGGMVFPIMTGVLLDRFKAAGNVTAGYTLLFGICGFAYIVAFAVNHFLAPKFETFALKSDLQR